MNLQNSVGKSRADTDADYFIAFLQAGLLPAQIETDKDGHPLFIYDAPIPGTLEYEVLCNPTSPASLIEQGSSELVGASPTARKARHE